jgi:hypothetical protein
MNGIFCNPFVEGSILMVLAIGAYATSVALNIPALTAPAAMLVTFALGYLTPHTISALSK